jgi:hypothetical protein
MSKAIMKRVLRLLSFYIESAAVIDRRFILDCIDDLIARL